MKKIILPVVISLVLTACGVSYQVEPPSSTTPAVVEPSPVETTLTPQATETYIESAPEAIETEPEPLPESTLEQPEQQPVEQPVEEQTPDVQAAVCDPSYPTICLAPPPPDINCSGISEKNFTVNQPDPHKLDTDKDGIGCEKK